MSRELKFVSFWLFIMSLTQMLMAQQPDTLMKNLEYQIEWYVENTENELDYSELTEELEQLSQNRVNLNSRERDELKRLFFLNEAQIQGILAYTANYGDFVSIYELKAIPNFDSTLIRKIIPFVTILPYEKQHLKMSEALKQGEYSILLRYQRILEKQEGYLPSRMTAC